MYLFHVIINHASTKKKKKKIHHRPIILVFATVMGDLAYNDWGWFGAIRAFGSHLGQDSSTYAPLRCLLLLKSVPYNQKRNEVRKECLCDHQRSHFDTQVSSKSWSMGWVAQKRLLSSLLLYTLSCLLSSPLTNISHLGGWLDARTGFD